MSHRPFGGRIFHQFLIELFRDDESNAPVEEFGRHIGAGNPNEYRFVSTAISQSRETGGDRMIVVVDDIVESC